jgi:hypothetical protein
MRTPVDDRLRKEAEVFRLRHTCDDCSHLFDGQCAHGYPTTPHRLPIAQSTEIVFCKEFELA